MRKIMFNDQYGLTAATLRGDKTMTRRIVTPKQERWLRFIDGEPSEWIRHGARFLYGEDIAVAQNYKDCIGQEYLDYVAKDEVCNLVMNGHIGCTNKMFVKANLMPNRIRIKNIKVERLQDISDEDCLKEGIIKGDFKDFPQQMYFPYKGCKDTEVAWTLQGAFRILIDKVSGRGTWESNPWVIAYTYELVKED